MDANKKLINKLHRMHNKTISIKVKLDVQTLGSSVTDVLHRYLSQTS